ncbi:MAG: hypothetical protein IPG99_10435 [Ignavibacteria bacterium]|nr:hypothetical protein [Ignavibacteria bacterium]
MSRSVDGGSTWSDFEVSDHRFKPKSWGFPNCPRFTVNGNQRLFPLWCSDYSGIYQGWMTKVELLPTNPCWGCEDFSNSSFTPDYFSLEYTGISHWMWHNSNAYSPTGGTSTFNFYNASSGTVQSMVTSFEPTPSGYYLTFDEAYASYTSAFGPDSLVIEISTNGGATIHESMKGQMANSTTSYNKMSMLLNGRRRSTH